MTPAYRITGGDKDITAALAGRLISLTITDKPGMEADEIEIAIADPDGSLPLPRRGVTLRAAIGWDSALVDKGAWRVDEIRHNGPQDVITIKGRSADLTGALRTHREESYHGRTLGQVLSTIAARHGLAPAVAPALAGMAIPHIDQTNESDVHFITRLAEQFGAVGTVKDGHLLFVPRGAGVTASGGKVPGLTIVRSATVDHDFSVQDREGETTVVRARWRDYEAARTGYAQAGGDADGEGSVTTLQRVFPTRAEAQAAARAALAGIARGQHELRLQLAYGRPEVIAGQPFKVHGWRPEIDAIKWITGVVTHTISGDQGYTTGIEAEQAGHDEQDP